MLNIVLWSGLGYAMVIINTIIGIYYNVIVGWTIYFFFASMTSELPWTHCGNAWNTDHCFTMNQLANITGIDSLSACFCMENFR